jgi:hypothetical protein
MRHGSPAAQPRLRRRQRQAGAVFIEALVVIGLIVVAMQCTWGLYRYCLFKHRAQLAARVSAWETALRGCGESKLGGVLGALSQSSDGQDVGGMRKDTQEAPPWVQVQAAEDGTVTLDLPEVIFGQGHVQATQNFACNEQGNHEPLALVGADNPSETALGASSEEQAK